MDIVLKNPKLISLIYHKLNSDLKDKVIVTEGSVIWVIDSETHDWFLQYDWDNILYYNKKFFDSFFSLFSLKVYSDLLINWFENLGFGTVKGLSRKNTTYQYIIPTILKNKKNWTLKNRYGFSHSLVRKVLELKKSLNNNNVQIKDFLTDDVKFSKILY